MNFIDSPGKGVQNIVDGYKFCLQKDRDHVAVGIMPQYTLTKYKMFKGKVSSSPFQMTLSCRPSVCGLPQCP